MDILTPSTSSPGSRGGKKLSTTYYSVVRWRRGEDGVTRRGGPGGEGDEGVQAEVWWRGQQHMEMINLLINRFGKR